MIARNSRSMRPLLLRVEEEEAEPHRGAEQFGGDQEQPGLREGEPQPADTSAGSTAGSCTCRQQREPTEPEGAAELDEVRVDVPQGDRRAVVKTGKSGADRDEHDLRQLADARGRARAAAPRRATAPHAARRSSATSRMLALRESPTSAPTTRPMTAPNEEADQHALGRDGDVAIELAGRRRGRRAAAQTC